MSDVAIVVKELGKRYRISGRESGKTLRETINAAALKPFQVIRSLASRNGHQTVDDEIIWALRNVSFEVNRGEVLGIIGRNGAGKSTLLKILSRITEPTEGDAQIHGRVGSLLEVGTGFHSELTGRENIYLNGAILGMGRAEIGRKFDEMVEFSGVEKFIDTPVKRYSTGMYLRLAFAVAAHMEPEILLVDEVLAVGDAEFQKKCLGKMKDVADSGRTILFVSHNMEAMLALCSECLVIDSGNVAFRGTPETSINFYHKMFSLTPETGEAHVIYAAPSDQPPDRACITRIEVLDGAGNPKPIAYTWDDVIFRIHYVSPEDIRNGAIILDIKDFKDQRLIVLDSGLQVPIKQGSHHVDCFVPKLALAAGEFFLAAGISLSNTRWVWREMHLGSMQVYGSDVLGLGRPPVYSRMIFAAAQEWRD